MEPDYTKRQRNVPGIVRWTVVTVCVHAILIAALLAILSIAGPHYVRPFREQGHPMPAFLSDVLDAVDVVNGHATLVWTLACGALLLDGLFCFLIQWRNDRVLGRVWSWLVAAFVLTLVVITATSILMAKSILLNAQFVDS